MFASDRAVRYHSRGHFSSVSVQEVDVLRSVLSCGLALTLATGVAQAQGASPADLLKDPAVKAAIDAAKATEAQTRKVEIKG